MLRNSPRQLATKSPQAACTAYTAFSNCGDAFNNHGDAFVPLQDAIFKAFYPAFFEGDLSDAQCISFSLPTRFAGLGINNPRETVSSFYHTTTQGTKVVVEAIKNVDNLALPVTWMRSARHDMSQEKH